MNMPFFVKDLSQVIDLSLVNITDTTPMGGQVGPVGATFKVWAPSATEVQVCWDWVRKPNGSWVHNSAGRLAKMKNGYWGGFVPGLKEGARYMFHVVGPQGGTEGLKRDPYARDLTDDPMWDKCQCLLYDPSSFPWHDHGYHPPLFHDLMIYQLHIGTWYVPTGRHHGTFLDVIEKLPYLKSLGINAIQPLPIVEFPSMFSLGYNGVDYFSPETDYGIPETDKALDGYLQRINALMKQINPALTPYTKKNITGTANQFRMMVDMCHLHGIAMLMDAVYNHAGGDFGDKSIYFFDRQPEKRDRYNNIINNNDSLYFTDQGHAGGLLFAFWKQEVKQFILDNALYYLQECHCDGLRYDQVSVMKNEGGGAGWNLCQYLTDTAHYVKPEAIHIAECWPVEQAILTPCTQGGAGFDATQNNGLRIAIRSAIAQAAGGQNACVNLDDLAREIASPILTDKWRAVQSCEDHNIVRKDRYQRIPTLADSSNHRSWYARSRSRVALGMVMTCAGIPHLFMGQEFLEDKQWNDDLDPAHQIWWDGLKQDKAMHDFHRFTSDLLAIRQQLPALRSSGLNIYHIHNDNRIIAFHRWMPGSGNDVVVIMSLNEATFGSYQLGMPSQGRWQEIFNSDAYDNWPNPMCAGNQGAIAAQGPPMHNLPASAIMVIPANSILIFKK